MAIVREASKTPLNRKRANGPFVHYDKLQVCVEALRDIVYEMDGLPKEDHEAFMNGWTCGMTSRDSPQRYQGVSWHEFGRKAAELSHWIEFCKDMESGSLDYAGCDKQLKKFAEAIVRGANKPNASINGEQFLRSLRPIDG